MNILTKHSYIIIYKNLKIFLKSVDNFKLLYYTIYITYRGVEQLAARRAHNPEVASSSLAPATTIEVLYLFFSYQNDFQYMLIIEERILPFAADVELGLTSILVKVDTFFYFILL